MSAFLKSVAATLADAHRDFGGVHSPHCNIADSDVQSVSRVPRGAEREEWLINSSVVRKLTATRSIGKSKSHVGSERGIFGGLGGYRQFKETIQIVLRRKQALFGVGRRVPELRRFSGIRVVTFWVKL